MNKMAAVRAVIISYRASTAKDKRSKIVLRSSLSAFMGFAAYKLWGNTLVYDIESGQF